MEETSVGPSTEGIRQLRPQGKLLQFSGYIALASLALDDEHVAFLKPECHGTAVVGEHKMSFRTKS